MLMKERVYEQVAGIGVLRLEEERWKGVEG